MAARFCVFCRRQPAHPRWEPFCSERCKLQDLAKWIEGGYRVPGEPADENREATRDDDENTGDRIHED